MINFIERSPQAVHGAHGRREAAKSACRARPADLPPTSVIFGRDNVGRVETRMPPSARTAQVWAHTLPKASLLRKKAPPLGRLRAATGPARVRKRGLEQLPGGSGASAAALPWEGGCRGSEYVSSEPTHGQFSDLGRVRPARAGANGLASKDFRCAGAKAPTTLLVLRCLFKLMAASLQRSCKSLRLEATVARPLDIKSFAAPYSETQTSFFVRKVVDAIQQPKQSTPRRCKPRVTSESH